jgi:hypothetical protein
MGQINSIDNTQQIEQTCYTRVYLPDFIRPAVYREIARFGHLPKRCDGRGVHHLRDVPGLGPDGIDYPDRTDV